MSWNYNLHEAIRMEASRRISIEDSKRQELTAGEILRRLSTQPGLILADEVGMGKTFVALAVAASVAMADKGKRSVVIMIPSTILHKWKHDFEVFRNNCLQPESRGKLTMASAENVVEFLRLADKTSQNRPNIIFLTHGAPYRSLQDKWLRLAIIKRALKHRKKNAAIIKNSLEKYGPALLGFKSESKTNPNLVTDLLYKDYQLWPKILQDTGDDKIKNPIPPKVIAALENLEANIFDDLIESLFQELPKRNHNQINNKLSEARKNLKDVFNDIWSECLKKISQSFPLLIMDEAHHMKNAKTKMAQMFQSDGSLEGIFERMLFLTATPFQLGHRELCSVLERMEGIQWKGNGFNGLNKKIYLDRIASLQQKLDDMQKSARDFNRTWGRLTTKDLCIGSTIYSTVDEWWQALTQTDASQLTYHQIMLLQQYNNLKNRIQNSNRDLSQYIIRHLRNRTIQKEGRTIARRQLIVGKSILDDTRNPTTEGLPVDGNSVLPFLLASRLSSIKRDSRPVFAEGLASSYEAFLRLKEPDPNKPEKHLPVEDDGPFQEYLSVNNSIELWYLDQMQGQIRTLQKYAMHPKVSATVEKATKLWLAGEKVLIFCHYIATASALKNTISQRIEEEINNVIHKKSGIAPELVKSELGKIARRFEGIDSRSRKIFNSQIESLLIEYPDLILHKEDIKKILISYFKSPSFLSRYYPIGKTENSETAIKEAFETKDASGLSLASQFTLFFEFLSNYGGDQERKSYLRAIRSIAAGSRSIVRHVTGTSDKDDKNKLMLAFNTPFNPEILIATEVMSEGVDLHLNCRHIIHHDLSWNPSNLEQRTGRIDRIGAKVEQTGQPIKIYQPYISATQDEKMYRVVKDRDRWFNILMGEQYENDYANTEKQAERLPLPEKIVEELTFKLWVA